MTKEELIKRLQETEDKTEFFNNFDGTFMDFENLFGEYLDDYEKARVLNSPLATELSPYMSENLLMKIGDHNIRLKLLYDNYEKFGFTDYSINNVINKLNIETKSKLVTKPEMLKKLNIQTDKILSLIGELPEDSKSEILLNKEYLEGELGIDTKSKANKIASIVTTIKSEDYKNKILNNYNSLNQFKGEIFKTYSIDSKIGILKNNDLNRSEITWILSGFNNEELKSFLRENKDMLKRNDILPHDISEKMTEERQEELLEGFDEFEFNNKERIAVFLNLKNNIKNKIDIEKLPDSYRNAFTLLDDISYSRISVDFDNDLEIYRDLDLVIKINAQSEVNNKEKIKELCSICPDMDIGAEVGKYNYYWKGSTVNEYLAGEEWIDNLINEMDPNYSDFEKLLYIDKNVGEKISYSSEYGTEVFRNDSARALWKIIDSGVGVCNGIANLEKYILDKVGIESSMVTSTNHAFLKIHNIEIPTGNGKFEKGNTIVDPTWNLTRHKFGAMPEYFCVSYDDIKAKGENAYFCHRNDKELNDVKLTIPKEELKNIYKEMGMVGKDGNVRIKKLIDKSAEVDSIFKDDMGRNIEAQLELLKRLYPDFYKSQNSTMEIMRNVLMKNKNMNFDKCVINRVYDKDDKSKSAVMYMHIDDSDIGRKFYYANKETGEFEKISEENFKKRFECYKLDLNKTNGVRPWEKNKDLYSKKMEIEMER